MCFAPPSGCPRLASAFEIESQDQTKHMIGKINTKAGALKFGSATTLKGTRTSLVDGTLTIREIETLNYVSKGYTSHEIADALHLGRETIETHRKKIMRKLCANNIVHAVALGLRKNIIQ